MNNLEQILAKIKQNQVVAYPTEAVFGLGCNPNSEQAVKLLLDLKKRPEEKGLILIAHDVELLRPYIDESQLSETEWQRLNRLQEQAITWVMPAKTNVPRYLTGKFNSIAVRICRTPAVVALCENLQSALTSTSANLSGLTPCRTYHEVYTQFGQDFPVLEALTDGKTNPSEIRDIFTQKVFRAG
ncbi:Sua5/YciO/YrdC/YwlC family protein [uncultured Actinobacillus sp.]|uniref:Sua5/YciO/YrdC/YwlC family protein n=1 Tax=uncultured Actinobacillus sp. TaxID=417616 RepID=UPI0025FF27F4|nr:Sua5/YciO/YrdC/YwlC family protein [uncultured Actinobacillus sp.]